MKNESESRLSVDSTYNKPSAPVITNYNQLMLVFVKQMLFDIAIPGRRMFSEDKKQNLRNQMSFYKKGFAKQMNDEQAYNELINLSQTVPKFIEMVKKTCFYYVPQTQEIEALVNKELNKNITQIESFIGNIKLEEKQFTIQWSTYKQKLYCRTIIDAILRAYLLSYMFQITILSALKSDFIFKFSIIMEYQQSFVLEEVPILFEMQENTTSFEFKFIKQ